MEEIQPHFAVSHYFCKKYRHMEQPFVFGVPADDPYFIGREKEIKRLEANFKYRHKHRFDVSQKMGEDFAG